MKLLCKAEPKRLFARKTNSRIYPFSSHTFLKGLQFLAQLFAPSILKRSSLCFYCILTRFKRQVEISRTCLLFPQVLGKILKIENVLPLEIVLVIQMHIYCFVACCRNKKQRFNNKRGFQNPQAIFIFVCCKAFTKNKVFFLQPFWLIHKKVSFCISAVSFSRLEETASNKTSNPIIQTSQQPHIFFSGNHFFLHFFFQRKIYQ